MTKSFYLALAAVTLLSVTAANAAPAKETRRLLNSDYVSAHQSPYASQSPYAWASDHVRGQLPQTWYEKAQADRERLSW